MSELPNFLMPFHAKRYGKPMAPDDRSRRPDTPEQIASDELRYERQRREDAADRAAGRPLKYGPRLHDNTVGDWRRMPNGEIWITINGVTNRYFDNEADYLRHMAAVRRPEKAPTFLEIWGKRS